MLSISKWQQIQYTVVLACHNKFGNLVTKCAISTEHYESTLKAQYETAKRMMRLDILEWERMPGKVCQTTSNHSDF